ncbi:MAG: segregation/condensation protein A [Syntrophomonadaceae bacterium]|nr:segregation/condensation protein A [Syntrophomonadaceae bacterium]
MGYSVKLDNYEGPLDLLLKLIEQNRVDIYDIPIASITDQYLAALETMAEVDLEVLADFLLMAATLINIKTRLLLPRPQVEQSAEDEEDPRHDLVNRLVEYRNFKALARMLEQRYEGSVPRVYFREPWDLEPQKEVRATLAQLVQAFRNVWDQKEEPEIPVRLPEGDIDIHEKMQVIEESCRKRRHLTLQELFAGAASRREALVLFLALLELIRLGRVTAIQPEPFGVISIMRTRSPQDAD